MYLKTILLLIKTMRKNKQLLKTIALMFIAIICFHLETWGQSAITNIPRGWMVNGKEARNGKVTNIADQSEVMLTPSAADLNRVKTVKAKTVSPWRGMSLNLSAASQDHIGWIIATNGRIYPHIKAAKSEKAVPVAAIAYIGNESNCRHGLAIALEDVADRRITWNDAPAAVKEWASQYAVNETTWRLPSYNDMKTMNGNDNGLYPLIKETGGQMVQHAYYWLTDENEFGLGASCLIVNNGLHYDNKLLSYRVRAILEF